MELLKEAFIEGYKQRAESSDLIFDNASRMYAISLFDKWKSEQLLLHVVSFSLFDKVYMDSPFGRYTGIVKGVEESKVIIESHSPTGNGMMLAGYDLSNNDWQKY